jgi:hypothetical protein
MNLSPLMYVVWALYFVAHLAAAGLLLRRRALGRFPFLTSLLLFEIALTITLFLFRSPAHYPQYFYIFWYASGVQAILRLGIVVDVVRSIPSIRYAPQRLMVLFSCVAVTVAAGSGYLASRGAPDAPHITAVVLSLARCVSVVWMTFGLALFFSVRSLGVGWTTAGLRVASGYFAGTSLSMGAAYAMTVWPRLYRTIDSAQTFGLAIVWLLLGVAASRPECPQPVTQEQVATYSRILDHYTPF